MTSLQQPTTTTLRRRPPSTARVDLLGRLRSEWEQLAADPAALATVLSWDLPGPQPHSLHDVLAHCGYRDGRHPAERWTAAEPEAETNQDRYLLRIVAVAADERLAARIVLQRILPALCAIAARRFRAQPGVVDVLDDLIGNAWGVIRRYPVQRRPSRVAANLVRDTSYATLVRPVRRLSASAEMPIANTAMPQPLYDPIESRDPLGATIEPLYELLRLAVSARRAGRISEADVELLRNLLTFGRTEQLARHLGCTTRTIRNHRDTLVYRLRSHADEAA